MQNLKPSKNFVMTFYVASTLWVLDTYTIKKLKKKNQIFILFATEITRRRDTTGIEPHDLPGGPLLWPGGPCWQNLTSPQRSILLCDQKEKTQHRLFTGHPCLDWRRLHITSLCSIRFSFSWIEQFHFDWAEKTRHIYIASHRLTWKTWPDIILSTNHSLGPEKNKDLMSPLSASVTFTRKTRRHHLSTKHHIFCHERLSS